VVLSQYLEAGFAEEVIATLHGRIGYLLKERVADPALFVDAVKRVAAGEVVVDPEIVRRLLRRREDDPLADLTEREIEVLAQIAEGRSNQSVAQTLKIAQKTVETHINVIFSKLGLEPAEDDNRRVLAVLHYLRGRS